MQTLFETYLDKIRKAFQSGKATEHTYRSTLEELLETLAPNIIASNDPKQISAG